MSLTCSPCLRGDTHRCERGECAWWQSRPKRKVPKPRGGRREGAGRPPWYKAEQVHEVAVLLIMGNTITAIAEHTGIGRDKIRWTRAGLEELEAADVSAGPVVGPKYPDGRHRSGFASRRPSFLPPPLDLETEHKVALLLLEGATHRRAAELGGVTHSQSRTVMTHLLRLQSAAT